MTAVLGMQYRKFLSNGKRITVRVSTDVAKSIMLSMEKSSAEWTRLSPAQRTMEKRDLLL